MTRILVLIAKDFARRKNPNRRLVSLHIPDLYPRSMGPGQIPLFQIKRILHITSWMIGIYQEGFKIVPFGLNFRAINDLITHLLKDCENLLDHPRDRMEMAKSKLGGHG